MDAVDAEGAADEMALDTDATEETALDADATDDIALDTDADALLTPLEMAEETDAGAEAETDTDAEDATLVRMEDTTSLVEAGADDTAEETSLDWASPMAARRRAQRAERRALRTTMTASTSRKGGLGKSSEDAPWVYIPRWSDEKHEFNVVRRAEDGGKRGSKHSALERGVSLWAPTRTP